MLHYGVSGKRRAGFPNRYQPTDPLHKRTFLSPPPHRDADLSGHYASRFLVFRAICALVRGFLALNLEHTMSVGRVFAWFLDPMQQLARAGNHEAVVVVMLGIVNGASMTEHAHDEAGELSAVNR